MHNSEVQFQDMVKTNRVTTNTSTAAVGADLDKCNLAKRTGSTPKTEPAKNLPWRAHHGTPLANSCSGKYLNRAAIAQTAQIYWKLTTHATVGNHARSLESRSPAK